MNETEPTAPPADEEATTEAKPSAVAKSARLHDRRWESELQKAQRFVQQLQKLRDARRLGDLAMLRRNAGETQASSRNVLSVFYKLQPPRGPHIEKYFLVATLFDLNRTASISGDFGETMKLVHDQSSDSFERRFLVLLDADFGAEFDSFDGYQKGGGELAYRLRQMVKLAASKKVGINWPVLLADLCLWDDKRKPVQKKWASNFYQYRPDDAANAADAANDADDATQIQES